MSQHRLLCLIVLAAVSLLPGCAWLTALNPFGPRPGALPPVLPPAASLEQVLDVVNRNNAQIESFSTQTASVSASGMGPALHANLVFQRQRRLRLRADFMTSPEIDLGSNDEGFWFWVKRNQPPAVFWCRHDQFATSPARQMIPLEPDWFVDAMGLALFDPALPHQGPVQLPGGRKLQIDTIRETPQGPMRKVTIVDAAQGWILEQRLHDPQGRLLASSVTEGHQQDPATGLWMARTARINCPAAQFGFELQLGQVRINQITGDPMQLWSVPNYPGAPIVDIGRPDFQMPGAAPSGQAPPYARRLPEPQRALR